LSKTIIIDKLRVAPCDEIAGDRHTAPRGGTACAIANPDLTTGLNGQTRTLCALRKSVFFAHLPTGRKQRQRQRQRHKGQCADQ
jgi:hypothetical protein